MGQCLACGKNPPSKETYQQIVQEITSFLHGGFKDIRNRLTREMTEASEVLNFERAKELRDTIQYIDATMEQQKMAANDLVNRDVFGYSYDKGWMCVQVFFIRQGKLIERDVSIFPFYDNAEEAIVSFIARFYLQENHLKPKQVLVPIGIDDEILEKLLEVNVHTPLRGRKKEMVELAEKMQKSL